MSVTIPIGPYFPSLEEQQCFELQVEGEKVMDATFNVGYNHRGIEWISTQKTFDQVPFLVERICGICSASHPAAYVQAVEDLCGTEVPERAQYIRSLILELERIHSHLLWVGLGGHFIGYNTVWMWAWKYREPLLQVFEKLTGNRNHYAMSKVGGVRKDVPDSLVPEIDKLMDEILEKTLMLTGAVLDDPVLHARLKVGPLTKEEAKEYSAVGPTARGAGLLVDVRLNEPYAAYDKIDYKIITSEGGTTFAQAVVRLLELPESIKMVKEILAKLPAGPWDAGVKEIPEGEGLGRVEAPRGEAFHHVRSDGGNHPIRHKVRAPTYCNLPAVKAMCKGCNLGDFPLILASIDPCFCCTDRMVVLNSKTGTRKVAFDDLLKLGWEETERLRKKFGAKAKAWPEF